MPKTTYIERHQLGEQILQLSFKEGKTDTEVAAILTASGHKMSQPTVSRWLDKKRQEMGNQVTGIMQEHLQRELPKDLDVLEELEALMLEWTREDTPVIMERLKDPSWCADAFSRWKALVLDVSDAEKEAAAVKTIIGEALGRVLKFFDLRKEKLSYIKGTRDTIGLKLQYSGVIAGAEKGNIVIMTSKNAERGTRNAEEKTGTGEKPKLTMVLKKGD
jgi:hypothetical protein